MFVSMRPVAVILTLWCITGSLAFHSIPYSSKRPPINDPRAPPYKEYWFTQFIDHFDFSTVDTWQQRFLVASKYWTGESNAPIYFYTGNEGPIETFYFNSGAVFEWASQVGALVVFAEHRFYGQSLPFGNDSFAHQKLGKLSVEQALADFAEIIRYIKEDVFPTLVQSPVLSFGGSYGGILTAWFRQKYPNVIEGGLASSAPVLQWPELGADPYMFFRGVTNDWAEVNPLCPKIIRQGFNAVQALLNTTEGLASLTSQFRLCKPLQTPADALAFLEWLTNAYIYLAMVDYPYPTSFLQPLPAWPVNVGCSQVLKYGFNNLLEAIYQGPQIFYNTTGSATCNDISPSSIGANVGLIWWYQACTEMTICYGSNGVTDMFLPAPYSIEALTSKCQKQYGVTPRVRWMPLWAGGWNITASSNIIFSNGRLDPWCGGGILHNLSDSLVAIVIEKAAHHLDLRFSEAQDPPEVTAARAKEASIFQSWLTKYYARKNLIDPTRH